MKLYVMVGEDRHCDNTIKVFSSREGAMIGAGRFINFYRDAYKWTEHKIQGWVFYACTDVDEGPKVRIEETQLDPEE